jgi:hypothetical protein
MTAEIFLDLEGTIIDDLDSCTFLDKNCENIKSFIKNLPIKTKHIHIFTWGWLLRSDVSESIFKPFFKNVEKKLDCTIDSVVIKEDSLLFHALQNGKTKITLPDYEIALNDAGFTKEQSFIEMFKKHSIGNPHILIDDFIDEPKSIVFHNENKFFLDVPPIFPNIILLNPKNL